jgi:hypothetical protein
MSRISYASLVSKIEQIVASEVFGNYPSNWDEIYITRCLIKGIKKNLDNLTVTGFKKNLNVCWDAFRYAGYDVSRYSDIAILVKIMHKDNSSIEGVAIVETRKRTNKKLTFDGIKWNQIGKLLRNTPYSQLLLYDYEDIRSFSSNLSMRVQSYRPSYWREQMLVSPYTYAVVTPTNIAMDIKINDSGLYNFSLPFANQLVFRYLHGFDLEFSAKAIAYALGNQNKLGFANTLLCLYVIEEGAQEVQKAELNNEVWTPLE